MRPKDAYGTANRLDSDDCPCLHRTVNPKTQDHNGSRQGFQVRSPDGRMVKDANIKRSKVFVISPLWVEA